MENKLGGLQNFDLEYYLMFKNNKLDYFAYLLRNKQKIFLTIVWNNINFLFEIIKFKLSKYFIWWKILYSYKN